jgi:Cu/Ag efflux pump CusA
MPPTRGAAIGFIIEEAIIEGAVHMVRPKLMTICVVASLVPILWESGIGSEVIGRQEKWERYSQASVGTLQTT